MTLAELERMVGMLLPMATFVALAITVILVAKVKGTRDAQDSTIKTWRDLAEAREAALEERDFQNKELTKENKKLRSQLATQREIFCTAIDELVAGLKRAGINLPRPQMPDCEGNDNA